MFIRNSLAAIRFVAAGALLAFVVGCDVDVKDPGTLPDVDVDATPGEAPNVDVEGPDVEVTPEERTVTVPDVDVNSEEETITVPDVDVTPAPEGENE